MDLKTGLPRNGGGYKKHGSRSTQNTAFSGKGEIPIIEVICCEKHKMLFFDAAILRTISRNAKMFCCYFKESGV